MSDSSTSEGMSICRSTLPRQYSNNKSKNEREYLQKTNRTAAQIVLGRAVEMGSKKEKKGREKRGIR